MAEVRDEMRNIQQNCLDQIEAVQAEKLAFLEGLAGRDELFDEGVRELRTVAEAVEVIS